MERIINMKYGVGIDISKGKSTIVILTMAGEAIEEPFEFSHDDKYGMVSNCIFNVFSIWKM